MGEAPDIREQEDCPSGDDCHWSCDQHDPIHFHWTTAWPHAVAFTRGLRWTDDAAKVTCPACQWALGSQRQPSPIRDDKPEGID